MIPIHLDPTAARIALVGRGPLAANRLTWLRAGGAKPEVWSDTPEVAARSHQRLPNAEEIVRYHAVWIAGLAGAESQALAQAARAAGVLVNVEDVPALCDFHTPAVVRRGQLTLTAGTGGASPAVARAAREQLEKAFSAEWSQAVDEIADARRALRAEAANTDTLVADAHARLAHHGLA